MKKNTYVKTAIITGGGGAIGSAIALQLGLDGFNIVIWDYCDEALISTSKLLKEAQVNYVTAAFDITDNDEIEKAVGQVGNHFGSINVLVNCAGIFGLSPITNLDFDYWDKVMAINLKAPVVCTKACLPYMIDQKDGCIINISSISAIVSRLDNLAYAAAKAAILRVTKDLAMDLAKYGIRSNSVTPGTTDTPMIRNYDNPDEMRVAMLDGSLEKFRIGIPLKRLAEPTDHAATVSFLASNEAQHITGQNIIVDGGQTLA